MHLAQGKNLLCKSIKSKIIKRCLAYTENFSTSSRMMDHVLNMCIKKVLLKQKCWETITRRREPVTPFMINETLGLCHRIHEDSLEAFLCDWKVGQLCGYRLGECDQNEESIKSYPKLSINGTYSPSSLPTSIF